MPKSWLYCLRHLPELFAKVERFDTFMTTTTNLADLEARLETVVPQVIAIDEADKQKAITAQALAQDAQAELAKATDPDVIHRLEVQIAALEQYAQSRAAVAAPILDTPPVSTEPAPAG